MAQEVAQALNVESAETESRAIRVGVRSTLGAGSSPRSSVNFLVLGLIVIAALVAFLAHSLPDGNHARKFWPQSLKAKEESYAAAAKELTNLFSRMENQSYDLQNQDGKPYRLGNGEYGMVFALKGGKDVIKVAKGNAGAEGVLGENLPDTPTLLKVSSWAQVQVHGRRDIMRGELFTGQITRWLHGQALSLYGTTGNRVSSEEVLLLAASMAIALHSLHTKIKGYVVLHCDLVPKNVMSYFDEYARPAAPTTWRSALSNAVVFDYGLALIHKLQKGETVADNIFPEVSEWSHCRGTDWDNYFSAVTPFSAVVEWRELGILLYQLAKPFYDPSGELQTIYQDLFAGVDSKCNYRCAAEKNIEALDSDTHVHANLTQLIRYLILDHESIQDEVRDVLQHPAFAALSPAPVDVAQGIATVRPDSEFKQVFGAQSTSTGLWSWVRGALGRAKWLLKPRLGPRAV